jgi:hypothetical protein
MELVDMSCMSMLEWVDLLYIICLRIHAHTLLYRS